MNHIAFDSGAVASHTYPMLAIAAELARRGHRVSFATTARFAPEVAAAGVRPVVPDVKPVKDQPPARDFFEIPLRLLDGAIAALPSIEQAYADDPPDVVLSEDAASATRILAAQRGIPGIAVWPFFPGTQHWTAAYGRAHPQVAALLDELATVVPSPEEHLASAVDGGIVLLPRSFVPGDFGDRFTFVGPCLGRRTSNGHPLIGRPHVLVSLGSINTHHPGFFRDAMAAFADVPWEVVMSVGTGVTVADVPEHVHVHQWIPQLELLPSAVAMVCHAGMNSLMEAVYHGVPVVCVPRTPEQVANARRVVELGLGRALSPKKVSAESLRAAVLSVTGNPAYLDRIHAMSAEMRAAGGVPAAADVIESRLATVPVVR